MEIVWTSLKWMLICSDATAFKQKTFFVLCFHLLIELRWDLLSFTTSSSSIIHVVPMTDIVDIQIGSVCLFPMTKKPRHL